MTDYSRHTTGPDVDPEAQQPLRNKYRVIRRDGSNRKGKKHAGCDYYVLDLVHDKFSAPALRAYAAACKDEYPQLAADILERVDQHEAGSKQ